MVTELSELMRESVADAPPEPLDLDAILAAGRGRVRRRRAFAVGGVAALTAVAVLAGGAVALRPGEAGTPVADGPPAPTGPTVSLADAVTAEPGRDVEVLTSHTNENLNRDNGEYFDGVTDDGLVLFRAGPYVTQERPRARLALLDPATGAKDWLPDAGIGQRQYWPVELGRERLVLVAQGARRLTAWIWDRTAREWTTRQWEVRTGFGGSPAQRGPDGRLYVGVPATQGAVPEGGWPRQEGGDAEDAGAEGDTYDLWSVGLDDEGDVRDEGLRLGSFGFSSSALVWTDGTNGAAGQVHVRDLASDEETSFDPRTGERCNLLSFGVTDERVVLGQYCGTYGDVRDDRVQVLSLDGEQVLTVQDDGVEGGLAGPGATNDLVVIEAYQREQPGTYVLDPDTDRLLRVSDGVGSYSMGGPVVPGGQFLWQTPVNRGRGTTQWLGRLTAG